MRAFVSMELWPHTTKNVDKRFFPQEDGGREPVTSQNQKPKQLALSGDLPHMARASLPFLPTVRHLEVALFWH